MQQQCELLGVPRSTYYYQPRPESAENLRLLRRLDELYLECPFFGSRRMAVTLKVNWKLVPGLHMAVEAVADATDGFELVIRNEIGAEPARGIGR